MRTNERLAKIETDIVYIRKLLYTLIVVLLGNAGLGVII